MMVVDGNEIELMLGAESYDVGAYVSPKRIISVNPGSLETPYAVIPAHYSACPDHNPKPKL
jgi:hypothetical protein